jgi:hypothetical protein
MNLSHLQTICDSLGDCWDGKASILRMQADNYNQWKQMEWAGFYFQYLIGLHNNKSLIIPGKKINKTVFDAHLIETDMPLDVKFHSNKNPKAKYNQTVALNDVEAMNIAIDIYGRIGVLVACGDNTYDDTGEFKLWHDSLKALKDGKSKYVEEGEDIDRKSRMRKVFTRLTHLHYYQIDQNNLNLLGRFQEGMKNSDGSPRRGKYSLNISSIQPLLTITK